MLFDEIVAAVASRTRALVLPRTDFPNLVAYSGRKRLNDVHSGRGVGPVNLPGAIKQFVKQNFPDFAFIGADRDEHHFQKAVDSGVTITLDFERVHHFGMGKTYTIWLGQSGLDGALPFSRHNLLEYFDRTRMDWCYGSAQELQKCLEETKVLLRAVLPLLEEGVVSAGNGVKASMGAAAGSGTAEDFHQAARRASDAVTSVYPQISRLVSAHYSDTVGPLSPAAQQRLRWYDGAWRISFGDDVAERLMLVSILHAGAMRFALGDMLHVPEGDVMRFAAPTLYPDELLALPNDVRLVRSEERSEGHPWDKFISVARLLEIVNAGGGLEFAADVPCYGRQIGLASGEGSWWTVTYRAFEGHNVFIAEVDAISGVVIKAEKLRPQ